MGAFADKLDCPYWRAIGDIKDLCGPHPFWARCKECDLSMNVRSAQPDLAQRKTSRSRARRWTFTAGLAWSLFSLCLVMVILSVLFGFLNGRSLYDLLIEEIVLTIAILAVTYSVTGALIVSRRPRHPIGWIFCAAAICQALIIFGEEYAHYALISDPGSLPLGAEMSWVKEWIWAPGLGLILVFLPLLFPDGRLLSRQWRWVAWLGSGSIGLISVLYMVALWSERGKALLIPGGEAERNIAPGLVLITDLVGFPLMLLAALGAIISQVVRFRRVTGYQRQQIKWFAAASAITLAFAIVYEGLPKGEGEVLEVVLVIAGLTIAPSIPMSTGIAILRYRLYDIDLVINRTLVYAVLSMGITGFYVLVVGYLGGILRTGENLLVSLVATGTIALVFAPLRERVQHGINRLMYGERSDPYAVLSRLGQHLKTRTAPDAVLQTIVTTAAGALKVPYAAIELDKDERSGPVAEWGKPTVGPPLVVPLAYGIETIGRLTVSPRAPGEPFDREDRRLLDDLARHAESAAYAMILTADLQRSRERLISAREEERRRLRRDLHDGLGPQLATLTLKLDAARNVLAHDSQLADTMLISLKAQTQAAITDIRRLVYDLRPPALDELGLLGAVREQATRYGENGLSVTVEAPDVLPPLPAAVEVAAYRIVQEALTNVVRHASARLCRVKIGIGGKLEVEITDDGTGLPENVRTGVGLLSMRERATELGGTCRIESSESLGGTRVLACLPLPTAGGPP